MVISERKLSTKLFIKDWLLFQYFNPSKLNHTTETNLNTPEQFIVRSIKLYFN